MENHDAPFRQPSHTSTAIGILKICQVSLPVLHTPIVGVLVNWTLEILQALEALEINSENARAMSGLCQLLSDFTLRTGSSAYSEIINDFAKDLEEISSVLRNILMRRNFFKKLLRLASDRRRLAYAKLQYDLAKGRFIMRAINYIIEEIFAMQSQINNLAKRVTRLESDSRAIKGTGFKCPELCMLIPGIPM